MNEIKRDLTPRCGFCHESLTKGKKYITGGPANICKECVGLCDKLLAEVDEPRKSAEKVSP
jgi:ATP-dependent protease Clp ATPase subunit